MKRFLKKSMLGVTLLEIMLVLAIAAMIIVMSVRYYQSASINQQANAFIAQLNAMQAAADSLASGAGTYAGITSASIAAITGTGAGGMNTPWGATIGIGTGTATTMTYTLGATPAAPNGVCQLVVARFRANPKWSITASTCTPITYTSSN